MGNQAGLLSMREGVGKGGEGRAGWLNLEEPRLWRASPIGFKDTTVDTC